jgi:hypothetical protein
MTRPDRAIPPLRVVDSDRHPLARVAFEVEGALDVVGWQRDGGSPSLPPTVWFLRQNLLDIRPHLLPVPPSIWGLCDDLADLLGYLAHYFGRRSADVGTAMPHDFVGVAVGVEAWSVAPEETTVRSRATYCRTRRRPGQGDECRVVTAMTLDNAVAHVMRYRTRSIPHQGGEPGQPALVTDVELGGEVVMRLWYVLQELQFAKG